MGTVNGKQLKVNHKRTAGLHAAGTQITDPTDWCMAFATDEEDYQAMKAVYEACTDEQKEEIRELLCDDQGMCFDNRERMSSHFSGLDESDFVSIKEGLIESFPAAFN